MEFASEFIVMNCDMWTSRDLLPINKLKKWESKKVDAKRCDSFLHIHLGFDAKGLKDVPIHSICVNKWERGINADQNVVVFSIPSVLDQSMAPIGKHVLHGYTPANEPWEIWENCSANKVEYNKLKADRCSIFINNLKKIIPDIESRIEVSLMGTPITHQKFTNTYCGSYGPAISASKKLFPGCKTPFKNLFSCGASTFPGIGIPAVAASGAYAAKAILGNKKYRKLMNQINT